MAYQIDSTISGQKIRCEYIVRRLVFPHLIFILKVSIIKNTSKYGSMTTVKYLASQGSHFKGQDSFVVLNSVFELKNCSYLESELISDTCENTNFIFLLNKE